MSESLLLKQKTATKRHSNTIVWIDSIALLGGGVYPNKTDLHFGAFLYNFTVYNWKLVLLAVHLQVTICSYFEFHSKS